MNQHTFLNVIVFIRGNFTIVFFFNQPSDVEHTEAYIGIILQVRTKVFDIRKRAINSCLWHTRHLFHLILDWVSKASDVAVSVPGSNLIVDWGYTLTINEASQR